jgi:predicted CXXCH cytochrome family protein
VPRTKATTKTLAQRIDLNYFKRPSPLRTWRFVLSLVALAIAVIWLAGYGIVRDNKIYSAGRMSPAHAVLTQRCGTCHVTTNTFFTAKVSDHACLTCHDGPIHHANQVFTPTCASCHVEHRGRMLLAALPDTSCTQCHSGLHTRDGVSRFVSQITVFSAQGHPEFAALRPGSADPGTIKFNHAVHLKRNLKGPNGLVQLECDDCHRANVADQNWRFSGTVAPASARTTTSSPQLMLANAASQIDNQHNDQRIAPPSRLSARAYMAPVSYVKHCAGCHGLAFDKRFVENVPHDTPQVVHAFVVKEFQDYIAAHPSELRETPSLVTVPPKPVPVSPRIYTPQQWVSVRVAEAEQLLWGKTCKECHAISFHADEPLPVVAKSNITARWFANANFDHDQHRLVSCESCHARARTSQETSDVLLPGIAICVQCHNSSAEGAESRCFECHTYHDWRQEKDVKSNFMLSELIH